jgi:hypothetical protein
VFSFVEKCPRLLGWILKIYLQIWSLVLGIFRAVILHCKAAIMYLVSLFLLENISAIIVFVSQHRRAERSDLFVLLRLDNIRSELCNVWG